MGTPYAHSRTRRLWAAAAIVGACYGAFLIVTALRVPPGAELTGQFTLQPAVKALTAVLLAGAALTHPVARERRWLIPALLFSAAGDFLLAMPWWEPSFVFGLAAFLVAHLCFLAAPLLIDEGMAVPVTLYIAVLGAMVCAALRPGCSRRGPRWARCASPCPTG